MRFRVTLAPDRRGCHASIAFLSRAALHAGAMNTTQVDPRSARAGSFE